MLDFVLVSALLPVGLVAPFGIIGNSNWAASNAASVLLTVEAKSQGSTLIDGQGQATRCIELHGVASILRANNILGWDLLVSLLMTELTGTVTELKVVRNVAGNAAAHL